MKMKTSKITLFFVSCIASAILLSACTTDNQSSSTAGQSAESSTESSAAESSSVSESTTAAQGGTDTKSYDYASEDVGYQFVSRHWDAADFKTRFEEFGTALHNGIDWKEYIALGSTEEDTKAVKEFFDKFAGKNVEYVHIANPVLYRVKGTDEYNDLRGLLEYKFRVSEGDKKTEYTTMLKVARHGDASALKWQISSIMWEDGGVDVSDVAIKQLDAPKSGEEVCIMTTDAGVIKMRLFPDEAPIAVKNWIELSKQGYYNGTVFGRVIKEFVIQGGALDGSGDESISIYDGFFEDEVEKGLYNFNGALCLGNVGPHTNGNQFYIVQNEKMDESYLPMISLPTNVEEKYKEVGGLPFLDGRYTVYGQVYEGMDVVKKIAAQETDDEDAPLSNPIKIISIEFETIQ